MADRKPFKKGSIATYEDAPAEDLRKRKEDLRAGIRNPVLTSGEFFREVVTHAFITAVAVGYSAWNAIERLIDWGMDLKNPWFRKNLTVDGGQTHYMANADKYEHALLNNSKGIATLFGFQGGKSAHQVAIQIVKDCRDLGHTFMVAELEELARTVLSNPNLSEAEKFKALGDFLKSCLEKSQEAHVSQYGRVWHKLEEIEKEGGKGTSATRFAEDAFHALRDKIIGSGLNDNMRIINKYRVPATVVLVTGATVFTALQSQKSAKRQKAIDQTAELTHIERLEKERAEAKRQDNAPQIAAS